MAKKYKYTFTKKDGDHGGRDAGILAAVSFGLFLLLSLVSFGFSGQAGTALGAVGLFAMLLSLYGCCVGFRSIIRQKLIQRSSIVGSIASGVVFILWLALFLVGVS